MSYREARNWLYYVTEHGSLSPSVENKRKLDQLEVMVAKLCYVVARSGGAKRSKMEDFLPKELRSKKTEVSGDAKLNQVFALLKSASSKRT